MQAQEPTRPARRRGHFATSQAPTTKAHGIWELYVRLLFEFDRRGQGLRLRGWWTKRRGRGSGGNRGWGRGNGPTRVSGSNGVVDGPRSSGVLAEDVMGEARDKERDQVPCRPSKGLSASTRSWEIEAPAAAHVAGVKEVAGQESKTHCHSNAREERVWRHRELERSWRGRELRQREHRTHFAAGEPPRRTRDLRASILEQIQKQN
jgi:hypothetical protein